LNLLRKARHILVCGCSGNGKTSYAERYIAASHHGRVFIYDWQDEFFRRLNVPRFGLGLYDYRDGNMPRIVCIDPYETHASDLGGGFQEFCNLCFYEAGKSDLDSLLVVDELQRLIPIADPPDELRNCYQTGRRQGLDTLVMSQQPNRLHNEIREQFTEIVFFRLNDRRSLDFVEERGADPALVSSLPPLHYLWLDTGTGETRQGNIRF
jgi:hypothetical protein